MDGNALRLRQRLGLSGPGIEGEERGEAERVPGLASSAVRVAPDPEVSSVSGRRRFSASYKARIVREADACAEIGEVGSLLRREGLYSSSLSSWRKEYRKAGEAALRDDKRGRKVTKNPLQPEVEKLRRDLERTEKKLAQAEMIIEFQKNLCEILGICPTGVSTEGQR